MATERKKFQTEVSEVLQIVIHSLYSNKEIFLRELISNASDAIDKARYESITNSAAAEGGSDWTIRLIPDEKNGTLTIRDNGIGMTKSEASKALGTIAHSGTKEFLKSAEEAGKAGDISNLIGQFGVGFYSAFMVADRVTVLTRKRGVPADEAVKWESDASSSYTIENIEKDTVGTDVIIKLKDDEKTYLNEYTLKRIVETYSDFIEYPIKMNVEKTVYDKDNKPTDEKEVVDETLNSMKAIWLKDKSEVTEDEQKQFYKHITKDYADPMKIMQIKAEGMSEFYGLLFIPSRQSFDLFHRDMKYGPMLYVKRVQIMENCEELVPQYLRFIKGVVDSSDLPLNVSRELLQNNRQVEIIRKNIVKKVLDTLDEMKRSDSDKYKEFFKEFGKVIKEGIHTDFERRENIASLCLFESTYTKDGEYTDLDEYISRMKAEQTDIYYITGESRSEMEFSPYIEGLKSKGYEVLFMTDEVDDIVFGGLYSYKEKNLKSALRGDLGFDNTISDEVQKEFQPLIDKIKEVLGSNIADVKLTMRLKDSPVFLVAENGSPDAHMEKLMQAMGQFMPKAKRVLEINPDHQLIKTMLSGISKDNINDYIDILYNQAVLLEGGKIDNMPKFIAKINNIMSDNA